MGTELKTIGRQPPMEVSGGVEQEEGTLIVVVVNPSTGQPRESTRLGLLAVVRASPETKPLKRMLAWLETIGVQESFAQSLVIFALNIIVLLFAPM